MNEEDDQEVGTVAVASGQNGRGDIGNGEQQQEERPHFVSSVSNDGEKTTVGSRINHANGYEGLANLPFSCDDDGIMNDRQMKMTIRSLRMQIDLSSSISQRLMDS